MIYNYRYINIIIFITLIIIFISWYKPQNEISDKDLRDLKVQADEYDSLTESLLIFTFCVKELDKYVNRVCDDIRLNKACIALSNVKKCPDSGGRFIDTAIQLKTKNKMKIINIVRLIIYLNHSSFSTKVDNLCLEKASDNYDSWMFNLNLNSRRIMTKNYLNSNKTKNAKQVFDFKTPGSKERQIILMLNSYKIDSEDKDALDRNNKLKIIKRIKKLISINQIPEFITCLKKRNQELNDELKYYEQLSLIHSVISPLHLLFLSFENHFDKYQINEIRTIKIDIKSAKPKIYLTMKFNSLNEEASFKKMIKEVTGFTKVEEEIVKLTDKKTFKAMNIYLNLSDVNKTSEDNRVQFMEEGLIAINDYNVIWNALNPDKNK